MARVDSRLIIAIIIANVNADAHPLYEYRCCARVCTGVRLDELKFTFHKRDRSRENRFSSLARDRGNATKKKRNSILQTDRLTDRVTMTVFFSFFAKFIYAPLLENTNAKTSDYIIVRLSCFVRRRDFDPICAFCDIILTKFSRTGQIARLRMFGRTMGHAEWKG